MDDYKSPCAAVTITCHPGGPNVSFLHIDPYDLNPLKPNVITRFTLRMFSAIQA